ncbi:hypothetical protein NDU88_003886 [Pleurodeles waltl]|uniref:Uncharacterized protein n=1 Tax=Pleurodeles waltl TaxID=8319 RepID=A0AAV7KW97_PLEWA|nr:hypothetical protein NDU88_003886 [Pleurodeles waltl]
MYHTIRRGGNTTHAGGRYQEPGRRQSTAHHINTLQSTTFSRVVPTPSKAWRKHITEEKRLTIGGTGKNNAAMEPELQVSAMIFYVMLHLEHQHRRRRRRWERTRDTCMDVVEVSACEVGVLLGAVMLVVDVDVVHAGVSVDVTWWEVEEEEEEEGETVEAADVVVSATVCCLRECLCDEVSCLCLPVPFLGVVLCACSSAHQYVCLDGLGLRRMVLGSGSWRGDGRNRDHGCHQRGGQSLNRSLLGRQSTVNALQECIALLHLGCQPLDGIHSD